VYEAHGIPAAIVAQYMRENKIVAENFPVIAMSPQAAAQKFLRNEVAYLPLAQVRGRVAATLAVAYPPGVGGAEDENCRAGRRQDQLP
jgi:ornithine decarboxylase